MASGAQLRGTPDVRRSAVTAAVMATVARHGFV